MFAEELYGHPKTGAHNGAAALWRLRVEAELKLVLAAGNYHVLTILCIALELLC